MYNELSDQYGYRQAWVDKLVREFAIEGRYQEITGMEPDSLE